MKDGTVLILEGTNRQSFLGLPVQTGVHSASGFLGRRWYDQELSSASHVREGLQLQNGGRS